jgi:hypothetical protein
LALPWICSSAHAQGETIFTPVDQFSIPVYNGTINFATAGTYTFGSLENESWTFVNLDLNNSQQFLNLSVSAQDSNITITGYQMFDLTGSNSSSRRSAFLSYTVVGLGKQTFNLGRILQGGQWSVSFNGNFVGETEGWIISPDQTLTITGATANVTIGYFNFINSFGGDNGNNSDLPFYQQHSVVIAVGVTVAAVVVLSFAINRKNKTKERSNG